MSNGSASTHPAQVSFDALNGAGLQAGLITDSWLDASTSGMIANTSGFSNISWPTTYGDACVVN